MLERIEAMRQKQLSQAVAKKEADESERRKQWEDVKEYAPDEAWFLTHMAKYFGKPAKVTVALENGVVLLKHG